MLPIWLKNSKGKYVVSPYLPITGYFHLLVAYNGRRGFRYCDLKLNDKLFLWVAGNQSLFDWTGSASPINADVYLLKDEF